ncbi:MAG: RsfS/YbeB/iojap family protein, partial [Angustibacter sp.]
MAAAAAATEKLATDLVALDVSEQLSITDAFLLVSAANERQIHAVVDA